MEVTIEVSLLVTIELPDRVLKDGDTEDSYVFSDSTDRAVESFVDDVYYTADYKVVHPQVTGCAIDGYKLLDF